ncbi:type II toxin-antitoxin system PemK/MazF family toxin [Metallumcola ferriviriculae]|uniref:Type II toxin-antitoxin system PemK/MazF family toxin n=1 Tax=Metallumcola ferriviriculae TaxID=3039180 RepID=A0AAU0UNY3_9FIRM|nr:type II toxin-antitoxin system PemK/MazF family toxin [Desulfitibacteraceae bacterium MK1]
MIIAPGEVWFAKFPLEEDTTQFLPRPVVVLDVETLEVLSVKVTKADPRDNDDYDTPIVFWQQAHLRYKSTARVSKTMLLDKTQFDFKIGSLHPDDFVEIQNKFMKFISDTE